MALDVENFLKPTFDALAAGLFCASDQDPGQIRRYTYDDSNFRYLFVHRLADAESPELEGVGVVVSIGKDHTKTLGTTLECITREKAGIIKEGMPVVSGFEKKFKKILCLQRNMSLCVIKFFQV